MNRIAPTQWTEGAQHSAAAAALRTGGIIFAGTLFITLCAHVSIPLSFTPVPLTLQPFAVLLLGFLLGPRTAFATLVAYLAEGAAGLPVFAPGPASLGGIAHLFGPTAGYLLSYPIVAMLISYLWRSSRRSFGMALIAAAAGDAVLLVTGAVWLAVWTSRVSHAGMATILAQSILPFLPGEALKTVAAAGIAAATNRLRRNN